MLPQEDWIMFMGDDHAFPPNLALKLLALMYRDDLDIIAPVCFKRDFPPTPVLYKYGEMKPGVDLSKYAYDENEDKVLYPLNLNAFPDGGYRITPSLQATWRPSGLLAALGYRAVEPISASVILKEDNHIRTVEFEVVRRSLFSGRRLET